MQKDTEKNDADSTRKPFSLFGDDFTEPLQSKQVPSYIEPVALSESEKKELAAQANRRRMFSRRSPVFLLLALNILVLAVLCVYLAADGSGDPNEEIAEQLSIAADIQAEQAEEALWKSSFFDSASVFAADELSAALPTPQRGYMAGMAEDFYALYAQNNDLAGWLSIPGTAIDYPVYQAEDNDKYLRADSYLEYDRRGSVFMDYRCHFGLSRTQFSACTILYGHHLRSDDALFAEIENYLDRDYYKAHPLVRFDTLYDSYTWKVIGCFLVNVDEADDNGNVFYYLYTDFASDADFLTFVDEIYERSWIRNPSVEVAAGDKLLLLSTCTYKMTVETEARCVLVCRLTRTDEPASADVSWASQSPSPRLPQVWYDQYADGINPWKDDPVWNITTD